MNDGLLGTPSRSSRKDWVWQWLQNTKPSRAGIATKAMGLKRALGTTENMGFPPHAGALRPRRGLPAITVPLQLRRQS